MSISTDALRELHRIHRRLADLREALERGPKQIRAGEGNVNRLQNDLEKTREALKRARMAADEKQLQLKGREDRVVDLKGKLNACSSNREYQALQEQIAADEQANSVLSDEILELFEKLDEYQEQIKTKDAAIAKAKEDLERTRGKVQTHHVELETQLGFVTDELTQAESHLPAEFKSDYDRMVKARGQDALAPMEDGCCGGCYHTLTPQMQNELHMHKLVVCKACGCMLYAPETKPSS